MTSTIHATWLAPMLLSLALLPAEGRAATTTTTGSGRTATEVRALTEFEAIALVGSIDLHVRLGTPQSVELSADDNLLPLLQTTVESTAQGATLRVGWKRDESISTRSPVQVTVVVPRLSSLAGAGSGDMRVESCETPT